MIMKYSRGVCLALDDREIESHLNIHTQCNPIIKSLIFRIWESNF